MNIKNIKFNKRESIKQIEEGYTLCPKFNENKLIPCITIEQGTNEVLMFSYVSEEGLKKTILTEKAHYFSRSRGKIWLKGETSGMYHNICNIFIDDDQDCLIYEVSLERPTKGGEKASCHVGYKSCFYRKISVKDDKISLKYTEESKIFDPDIVYEGIPNPTKI